MGEDQGPDPAEVTFADVLNGLSMGGGRPTGGGRARRRSGRAHGRPEPPPGSARSPQSPQSPESPGLPGLPAEDYPDEETASSVRAYSWTGGRTRSSVQLEIETLISTTTRAEDLLDTMRSEHQSVTRLCRQAKSVAEIGALLSLPIGVVRVLLDDMAGLGLVTVHATHTTDDGHPDVDLLQRVLHGLGNLRT